MLGVLDVILSICFVVCLSSILKTYSDISGTVSKNEAEIFIELTEIFKTDNVDVLDLENIPIFLKYKIIKNGNLIYENKEKSLDDFIENVLKFYFDEKYRFDQYYKDYEKSLKDKYAG